MNRLSAVFSVAVALVLAGCAGTDFKRPAADSLVLGKSTTADIAAVMGTPKQVGEEVRNGQKIKTLHYAYASSVEESLYPGVIAGRFMQFSTFNDLLVAQEFTSSFKSDGTDFDESKVDGFAKGTTTRAEAQSKLGKASGEAIYPVIKSAGDTALIYTYTQAKGSAFDMKFHSKRLLLSFDAKGVLTDIDFSSSGQK